MGEVSGLSGTCLTVTFTVGGKTIRTNASTVFSNGACTDVKNGVHVGVRGTAQQDGSLLAVAVHFVPAAPGPTPRPTPGPMPGPGHPNPGGAGIVGPVSGLSGSCLALTFTVAGKTVRTNNATRFENGACSDVKNGVLVGVRGTAQQDGSLLAVTVHIVPAAPGPMPRPTPGPMPGPGNPNPGGAGIAGPVSGLSGSCVALTFTVAGKTVRTNNATRFENGSCSDVKNGVHVGVRGTAQQDGSLVADVVHVMTAPRR